MTVLNHQNGYNMIQIKRITQEEADTLISKQEDMLGYPVEYYTLTPLPVGADGREWDQVTYYTGRSRAFQGPNREGRYWIYVLSNPSMPGLLKIGYTKNSPEDRAHQISNATGVATPFKVEYSFKCHEGQFLEEEVHRYLESYRVATNREFFKLELYDAVEAITKLGNKYIAT
jgi:hypothetical protein